MFYFKKGAHGALNPYAAPWERDANITDVWLADLQYMTFASGTTLTSSGWAAAKGGQSVACNSLSWHGPQPNNNSYSGHGDGYVQFSTSGFMQADGLGTKISGVAHPWTVIISGRIPVNPGNGTRLYCFGNSANANSLVDCSVTGTGTQLFFDRRTDANVLSSSAGIYSPGNGPFVLVAQYNGTTFTGRLNGVAIETGSAFGTGTITLNEFTLGGFRTNGGTNLFTLPDIRAIVFAPTAISTSSYLPVERYLMRQAGL